MVGIIQRFRCDDDMRVAPLTSQFRAENVHIWLDFFQISYENSRGVHPVFQIFHLYHVNDLASNHRAVFFPTGVCPVLPRLF